MHEVHVHLRGEALGDVGGGDPVGEGDQSFGMQYGILALLMQPLLELDIVLMHCLPACETGGVGDSKQRSRRRGFFGQQNARLFEELTDRADAVGGAVEVAVYIFRIRR